MLLTEPNRYVAARMLLAVPRPISFEYPSTPRPRSIPSRECPMPSAKALLAYSKQVFS